MTKQNTERMLYFAMMHMTPGTRAAMNLNHPGILHWWEKYRATARRKKLEPG